MGSRREHAVTRIRRRYKDALKYGTMHRLLGLGKLVPLRHLHTAGLVLSGTLSAIPTIKKKIGENMRLALGAGNVPAGAEMEYLRNLGLWGSYAIQGYHRGLMECGASEWIEFNESIKIVEDVMSLGAGAIYAVPHLFGHEIMAGLLARRYPTVGLVRESKYAPHNKVKKHFYEESGGIEVIYRPRRGSMTADMRACMRVLKKGKGLVITPDLLDRSQKGTMVELFGRQVCLRPGIVGLSMFTGAPVVRTFLYWRDQQVTVQFEEPRYFSRKGDPDETVREGMQWWTDGLAAHLRRQPTTWHFWLDRNWSKLWRTPPDRDQAK